MIIEVVRQRHILGRSSRDLHILQRFAHFVVAFLVFLLLTTTCMFCLVHLHSQTCFDSVSFQIDLFCLLFNLYELVLNFIVFVSCFLFRQYIPNNIFTSISIHGFILIFVLFEGKLCCFILAWRNAKLNLIAATRLSTPFFSMRSFFSSRTACFSTPVISSWTCVFAFTFVL